MEDQKNMVMSRNVEIRAFLIGLSSSLIFILVWFIFSIPIVSSNTDYIQRGLNVLGFSIGVPSLIMGFFAYAFGTKKLRGFFIMLIVVWVSISILSLIFEGYLWGLEGFLVLTILAPATYFLGMVLHWLKSKVPWLVLISSIVIIAVVVYYISEIF